METAVPTLAGATTVIVTVAIGTASAARWPASLTIAETTPAGAPIDRIGPRRARVIPNDRHGPASSPLAS